MYERSISSRLFAFGLIKPSMKEETARFVVNLLSFLAPLKLMFLSTRASNSRGETGLTPA